MDEHLKGMFRSLTCDAALFEHWICSASTLIAARSVMIGIMHMVVFTINCDGAQSALMVRPKAGLGSFTQDIIIYITLVREAKATPRCLPTLSKS